MRQVVGRFNRRTPGTGVQMSWLFLPSVPELEAVAATVEEERPHALVPEEPACAEDAPERAEREREDPVFHAPSSTGRLDDLLLTSQPGDQLGLFGAPSAPSPPDVAPAAPAPETAAYERRERLREERQALVAALSRRTGEPHRAIHARVSGRTGAASVAAAIVAQLEKGNARSRRELD